MRVAGENLGRDSPLLKFGSDASNFPLRFAHTPPSDLIEETSAILCVYYVSSESTYIFDLIS
jgi:hypothetical protein